MVGGHTGLAAQPAEPLGTLLYSPAQRQAIAANRKNPAGEPASALAIKSTSSRLDGIVARTDTKGTAWVNGEPFAQGSAKAPAIRGVQAIVEGQRLRVGESIDTLTGVKTDIVAPGAVRKGLPR